MYLDVVDDLTSLRNGYSAVSVFAEHERWADWPPTTIEHHGSRCCETAREWLVNTDHTQLAGGSVMAGPRWLRENFDWGPNSYPIFWCELVEKKEFDCGVHAALAYELFSARLVKCYRVQMVQEFSASSLAHWASAWTNGSQQTEWLNGDRIYHEGCAVTNPQTGQLKVWDSSSSWWIDSRDTPGYGSLRAIRLFSSQDTPVAWGDRFLNTNKWNALSE